ncbi:hypothetical protein [Pinibacter aurantiacus]|uniref:Uncharacterized protein n=1 Tax=Pinibacter aurantiacus TaxID=2851599 RepID=A0A9E2W2D0_9BACT|nr:hypothetical protein [Pinibacter aurantiacus]MBV4357195.1 hypothetical protein [Pinibacter aurantiacus]
MKKYFLLISTLSSLSFFSYSQNSIVKEIESRISRSINSTDSSYNQFTIDDLLSNKEIDSLQYWPIYRSLNEKLRIKNKLDFDLIASFYSISAHSNNIDLKKAIAYRQLLIINDSSFSQFNRNFSSSSMSSIDLSFYDNDLSKKQITINLDRKNADRNIILLAGALQMQNLTPQLQKIVDSNFAGNSTNAALALCRMGNHDALQKYFSSIHRLSVKNIVHDNWKEIEYIKQAESIDLLVTILFSTETEPALKETWPPEKLAYYGMEALDRMLKNCPIKVRGIYSNERDAKLEDMRKWVKNNRKSLVINKNIW